MSGMFHKVFDIHGTVAKSDLRLFSGSCVGLWKFLRGICHTHTFSTAAKSCLDDHRVADPLCFLKAGFNILHIPFTAWNYRNTCCDHGASCDLFVSKHADDLRWRSHKCNSAFFTKLRKSGIFRKETKSRMDGIRTGNHGGADDLLHIQIALCGRSRTDTDCFVCQLCVKAFLICLGINCHCGNSHFPAGTDNTHRDLASVGDQ